jgi:hypothetical protein
MPRYRSNTMPLRCKGVCSAHLVGLTCKKRCSLRRRQHLKLLL